VVSNVGCIHANKAGEADPEATCHRLHPNKLSGLIPELGLE